MRAWSIAALLLVRCAGPATEEAPPPEADRLVFKMKTKEQTDGCIAGSEGCAYVRLDYPALVDAPEGYAVTAVTNVIMDWLTRPVDEEELFATAEDLMTAFLERYQAFRERAPEDHEPFYLERKAFVIHNTPEILSLSFSERQYTGEGEGSATLTFENLDPRTGERITLSDVLVEGYEDDLLPLAETRFRELRAIEEGMTLTEAGFTLFDDGAFALTDNVSIGEKGLTFYYNAGEVAPEALGPTEIILRYDELDGLLKE